MMNIIWRYVILLLLTPTVLAQDWTPVGGSDDWFSSGNWTPDTVPGAADDVTVNAAATNPASIGGLGVNNAEANLIEIGTTAAGVVNSFNGRGLVSTTAVLGVAASGNGSVLIDGWNAWWNNSGSLTVGSLGAGLITIAGEGALFNGGDSTLAAGAGSTGTVIVDGELSEWNNAGALIVGGMGMAVMTLTDQAEVSNTVGIIGLETGASGTVSVSGGAAWRNTTSLVIGDAGSAELTLTLGGIVTANSGDGTITLAREAGSSGVFSIGSGASVPGWVGAATIAFGDGDGVLRIDHNATPLVPFMLTANLTSTGTALVHVLAGFSDYLADGSGYTGALLVDGGTFLVNNALGNMGGTATVEAGRLGGTGPLGTLLVNGGTLAPGNSIETLHVVGDATFAPGSVYEVELDNTGDSDLVIATGDIIINGGTVEVLPEAGSYPLTQDYVILQGSSVVGVFDGISVVGAGFSAELIYTANEVILRLHHSGSNSGVATLPTLSQWSLVLLALLLAWFGARSLRVRPI